MTTHLHMQTKMAMLNDNYCSMATKLYNHAWWTIKA
jgi:hypothetical protein